MNSMPNSTKQLLCKNSDCGWCDKCILQTLKNGYTGNYTNMPKTIQQIEEEFEKGFPLDNFVDAQYQEEKEVDFNELAFARWQSEKTKRGLLRREKVKQFIRTQFKEVLEGLKMEPMNLENFTVWSDGYDNAVNSFNSKLSSLGEGGI